MKITRFARNHSLIETDTGRRFLACEWIGLHSRRWVLIPPVGQKIMEFKSEDEMLKYIEP